MDQSSPEVVNAMLQFIYSEGVDNFKGLAWDLLLLAIDYEIGYLEYRCLVFLSSQICLQNLFDCFAAFEDCYLPILESDALSFAMKNIAQVKKLPEWPKFISGQSKLAVKLLNRMNQMGIPYSKVKEETIQFKKSAICLFGC